MNLLHKLARTTLAAALAATLVPAAALATEAQPEATTNNLCIADEASGWGFYFDTDEDGTATITASNEVEGATSLTLPTTVTVGSCTYTITEIASSSTVLTALFYSTRTTLEQLTLPQQLVTIGNYMAYGCTALTKIDIPASVWGIGDSAFRNCTALEEVNFSCNYMGYFGNSAFRSCTALTEFTVPALLRSGSTTATLAIGGFCFAYCTSLTTVYFLSGNVSGADNYNQSTLSGHSGNSVFTGCSAYTTSVYFCTGSEFSQGQGAYSESTVVAKSTHYFTVDFFASAADQQAAITTVTGGDGKEYEFYDRSQALASVTLQSGTSLRGLLNNTLATEGEESPYLSGALSTLDYTVPSATALGGEDALWYLTGSQLGSANPTLSASAYAYVKSRYDLSTAWLSVSSSYKYVSGEAADLSDVQVFAADGEALPTASYELMIYLQEMNLEGLNGSTIGGEVRVDYYDYDDEEHPGTQVSATTVAAEGQYTIFAQGTEAYGNASTKTSSSTFTVTQFSESEVVKTYSGATAAKVAANAHKELSQDTSASTIFNVLVDAEDTATFLVAASLAGLGGGIVAYAEDGALSSQTKYALNATGASELVVLETTAGTIADSVLTDLRTSVSALANGEFSRFPLDDEGFEYDAGVTVSASEMALSVYNIISAYGPLMDEPYNFSDVALVASATSTYGVSCAAQLAYQAQAAVFYTEEDGSLSQATQAALAAGGFTSVYIIGPESYVSATAASTAATAAGTTAARILTASSAYENATQLASLMMGGFGSTYKSLVVADARNLVLANAAAVLAAREGGICYLTASSEDEAAVATYIATKKIQNFTAITYLSATDTPTSSDDTITQTTTSTSGSAQTGSSTAATKKAQTITLSKKKLKVKRGKSASITVKGAKGTLKATSSTKKIKVSVSGAKVKIKVKKGCKKGKFTIKIYAKAKGNYKQSATKTLTIQVK